MFTTQKTVLPAGDFLHANGKISFLKKKVWPFRPSQFRYGSKRMYSALNGIVKYPVTPKTTYKKSDSFLEWDF